MFRVIETVTSTELKFLRGKASTVMRVERPGRTLRPLLNVLERAVGYGFSSTAVDFEREPRNPTKAADSRKIVSLKIKDVSLQPDCVARMEFASKQGLAHEAFEFLDGVNYRNDLVKYELVFGGVRGSIAYSSVGVARIGGAASVAILRLLEDEIVASS